MSRNRNAIQIGELLNISYAHALRLVREASKGASEKLPFPDLAHACAELLEEENSWERRARRAKNDKRT